MKDDGDFISYKIGCRTSSSRASERKPERKPATQWTFCSSRSAFSYPLQQDLHYLLLLRFEMIKDTRRISSWCKEYCRFLEQKKITACFVEFLVWNKLVALVLDTILNWGKQASSLKYSKDHSARYRIARLLDRSIESEKGKGARAREREIQKERKMPEGLNVILV